MKDPIISNNTILVLPSWYPSKVDPFSGDFIQRHVKAISLYNRQYVIFVIKDDKGIVDSNLTIEEVIHDNYVEKIIYYKGSKTGISLIDKIISQVKYKRAYRNAINEYIERHGCPKLIHVHVAYKAGIIALWVKKKWSIPFVLTEHWTIYLKEADLRFSHFSIFKKKAIKNTIQDASALSVVSDWLGKAIQNIFPQINYAIIPNVVDDTIFFPVEKLSTSHTQFIHASTLNYQKNIEAIIMACSILKERKFDFVLKLFGPAPLLLKELVDDQGLNNEILFVGEVDQKQLAGEMQQSDALILYSRFETFGCVLIEANATGIPVIVSDLPVFHELVTENENGLFVAGNNSDILADKLIEFIANKKIVDKSQIVKSKEKYVFSAVGKQFAELYKVIQDTII